MTARRWTLTALISLCALAGLLGLTMAPAYGEITHVYQAQITGPSPTESFRTPWGLSFGSTGNLFVADAIQRAVDVFNSANVFAPPQLTSTAFKQPYTRGVAAATTGNLYVAESGPVDIDVLKPEAAGKYGLLEEVNFASSGGYLYVAVDNHPLEPSDPRAGDVYVLTKELHVIKPDAEGRLRGEGEVVPHVGAFTLGRNANGGLAVDAATGSVYVADPENHVVDVFDDKGEEQPLQAITGSGTPAGAASFEPVAVAIDDANDVIYVVDQANRVVDEFSKAGTWLGQIKQTTSGKDLEEPLAVAVQEHTGSTKGDVYVSDGGAKVVDVFAAAGVVFPDVTTGGVSGVAATAATLNGTVNPDEVSVSACRLEYGMSEEAAFTHSAPCVPSPGSGNTAVSVSATLSGLAPHTTYIYRLAATNANGTNYGPKASFTTPPAVEGVSTGPAEAVTPSAATLTGSLAPDGTDAHYYFEYGTSRAYGSTSPALPGIDAGTGGADCVPPGGSGCSPVSAETTLSSLVANTIYHYRLVAVNQFGTTAGPDEVFKTLGPPRVHATAEVKPAEKAGQTTATLQAQIDPDGAATSYRFEYGETTSYGTSVPVPDGTAGSGQEFVSVPAGELSKLKIGETYHYRVVASSEYGTTTGPDQQFQTLPAVLIEQSASGVAATSASLRAQINPLGSDTRYYFQYGTSAAYTASVPAPPGADIGAGESDVAVSVHLQGLTAGTTYHYRVVAINEPGGEPMTVESPDATFTTQSAGTETTQPDGRMWELASPPNKQGSAIVALGNEQGSDIQASAGGDGIVYTATASFVANPAANRSLEVAPVISTRSAPGSWETADITTPHNEGATYPYIAGDGAEYKLFSSDLSLGLTQPVGDTPLPPLGPGAEQTIYLRGRHGEYIALVSAGNVPSGTKFGGEVDFVYASPDLSHVVLSSTAKLTSAPLPPRGESMLYEWADGQLRPASVLPNGESTVAELGAGSNIVRNAVSSDGSRLVWKADPNLANGEGGHLYMRDMEKGEIVPVDAAQGTPEPAQGRSVYSTASSDDSRVFFTNPERLTADSTAQEGEDLYVFEVTSGTGEPLAGKLTDLTVDANAGETAEIRGVIGASEDGSYVYFVASGVLGDGAEHGAVSGGNNLYVEHYDAASGWAPAKLVAVLSDGDKPTWDDGRPFASLRGMTSRVSPNGRYLAFMSERSLTGYENRDASSGVPDEEVFHYDAGTGRLVCASCDPTGARPVGLLEGSAYEENLIDYAKIWGGRWLAGNIPGWNNENLGDAKYQSRYLSDSGRLFFNSSDALVPADVNGKEDVYEYEPVGVGGCQPPSYGQSASVVFSQTMGGCVGLISAGTSTEESAFMDASESGGDVFFLTLSHLAPQDYDSSVDMYDAHECTASAPCAPAPVLTPPPCTTGDACKAGPTPQPALFGAPSSETFSGAGNVVPSGPGQVTGRSLSQAQKLTRALKACARKPKRKRAACKRQARRKYGTKRSRVGKSSSARSRR